MCQCGLLKYHDPKTKKNKNKNTRKDWYLFLSSLIKRTRQNQNNYFPAAASSSVLEEGAASHPQPAAALPSALSADPSPVGDVDSAAEPSSSVEHAIDDPGDGADDNVPGGGSINSVEHELDDTGGGAADDDPGGGSITSADADSALIVSNASKTSSSPLLSSFATGLTSSRASSSIVAMDVVSDDSDDEDVEYKGHFCSGCSIPPPGGVRGWVRGYGGVGLWEAGPGCACCEDYD